MMKEKMNQEKTLKSMMIKAVILYCLLPFLLLWLSFAAASGIQLKRNIESEQKTIVNLMGMSIENYLFELEEAMGEMASNSKIQNILKNIDRKQYDSQLYNANQYIQSRIGKIIFEVSGVDNIILADLEGGYYSAAVIEEAALAYIQDIEKLKDEIHYYKGQTWLTSFSLENGETLLIMVKPVVDLEEAEFVGMLYFVIRESEISRRLKDNQDQGEAVLLLNEREERLYTDNEALMENRGVVITQSKSNRYGISVITGVSMWQYMRSLLGRQLFLLLLFAAIVILVFTLVLYIYRKINGEISGLLHPDRKGAVNDTSYFEIKQINNEMMSLIEKNQEGGKKIVKLMNHCDTMTLDKLQAQINPHFLYNTLTSIKYIAMENEQKQISDLITALVKLLRSTINREGLFISLEKEVENVKNYMYIQNAVYKGNVDFQIEISEALLSLKVPNFILQPLVENCIFHGIHPEEKGGKILITAELWQQGLLITVEDNGDGFSSDCIFDMMGAENNQEMMTNFGLKGVQQKIQISCGENYGLLVKSRENKGAKVEIHLPAKGKEGEDGDAEGNDCR